MKDIVKLLVIEDNEEIIDLIELYKPNFIEIIKAKDGKEGLEKYSTESIDVIVLDIMLPLMNGYDILKNIRESSDIPVIILSSKNLDYEIILGLDKGADDYMVKPFNPMELFARIKALLRRSVNTKNNNEIIKSGDLELNQETCEVFLMGEKLELTAQEYKLLELFMTNKKKVFTKAVLLERIWENEYYDENVVSVYISRLREKIGDKQSDKKHIITIRGLGYKFDD